MDTPVLARTTTPVTGSPFETAPGIAGAFPMGKVAFPGAGEADSGPPSKRRRPDYPAPVAGRLALNAAAWRDITDNAYVLQAVQGYLLDFHTRPPIMSARQANAMETTMNSGKAELLDAEVTELLRKEAIEKCNRGPGFYSRMFLVPKKGGKSRPHLLSAAVRVYSLVAPCRLSDLTSLALLGSVSGQRRLSRGPLPGYKTVSKWRLQLPDSTPFPLLSQRICTSLHTSASLGCYLLFTLMPDCPLAPLGQV